MTDGSYSLKHSGSVSTFINLWNASYNDKIYYASNTHSALFIDNPSNGAPLATGMARSKWGGSKEWSPGVLKIRRNSQKELAL